jgi:hypothetical protein
MVIIMLKLELGCGPKKPEAKQEGWTYVDIRNVVGVDIVADLTKPWPWEDGSVDEVLSAHLVEHFEPKDRMHFFQELYRVLKVEGKAQIITPHWAHCRAYGDLTHVFPPVVGEFYSYLNKEWREREASHSTFTCNFDTQLAGAYDPNDIWISLRTDEEIGRASCRERVY